MYEYCAYGCEELGFSVDGQRVTVKMDTGCSRCMSGVPGRLLRRAPDVDVSNVVIKGFNDSKCGVDGVGVNADGKTEYLVSAMPSHLVLLCAHDYARDGAIVLYDDGGYVYNLTAEQRADVRVYMSQYAPSKVLEVRGRTYDVVDAGDEEQGQRAGTDGDVAHAATTYFNTKVNVSNTEERILAYLISGLTMRDLYKYVEHGSIAGLHPDVTTHALSRFKHKWGSTPDAFQLANPGREGNRKGYMSEVSEPQACGEYVEMDFMECDFNDAEVTQALTEDQLNGLRRRKKVRKLATHGGAIAGNVCVDAYSGYIRGELVLSTARPIDIVRRCVQSFALDGHAVSEFAADSGVSSQSTFQVFTPEVEAFLLESGVKSHRSEPYNHSNGTPHVENAIKTIKARIRMGVFYILRNPNFHLLGFSKQQVLKLWGELFYWAITTMNMSECPHVKGKTKYEVFKGRRPNIQEIRLLPIFAVVMVYRHVPTAAVLDQSNHPFYQYGLYVGPDTKVTGGIRVAVITNEGIQIVVTTKYKGVSDGGGINVYPHVAQGLQQVLADPVPAPADGHHAPDVTYVGPEDVRGGDVRDRARASASAGGSEAAAAQQPQRGELPADAVGSNDESSDDETGWVPVRRKEATKEKDQPKKPPQRRVIDREKWPDRAARSAARGAGAAGGARDAMKAEEEARELRQSEEGFFCDWSNHGEGELMYSFTDHSYYVVKAEKGSEKTGCKIMMDTGEEIESGFTAVTKNVPKNFTAALQDKVWGEPARKELSGLMDKKTLVLVDKGAATEDIRNGADLVVLFPVYEEKIKEGELVRKVRLVCNGKTQHNAGATYSPTPTREELFIVLHMCAKLGWDYCHMDEVRAFLNAPYLGETTVYAKLRADPNYYKVLGALYGLKTSPRHYNVNSAERLISMGFTRLHMCSCIWKKKYPNGHIVLVYAFVDDYFPFGDDRETTASFVREFEKRVPITTPIWNATSALGMTMTRNWEKHTIEISLANKIGELGDRLGIKEMAAKKVPIPASGYIVKEHEFDDMKNQKAAEFLSAEEIVTYMQIVGSLIWISGVRHDINYGLMYLTWFTKKPRVHHMSMAYYMVSYLYHSKDVPLVLGGTDDIVLDGYCDSSWGTGPKGRSICAVLMKLSDRSACIVAKATASLTSVRMSSFESELETCTLALKTFRRIVNILDEMGFEYVGRPRLHNDNEAMINFVKGEGVAKGIQHVELRMWYIREQYAMGNIELVHMSGKVLPADRMTKPSTREEFEEYRYFALGLGLL